MKDRSIRLSDGRTLAFADLGAADGLPVFFFHGAPSCRLALEPLESSLAAQGVRVIAPDRPGYGASSPHPGRTLAGWTRDVATLASELGIERFAVAGHSSGGPYAIACGALLPQVTAAAAIAGVTDMAWPTAWSDWRVDVEAEIMRAATEDAALALAQELVGDDGGKFELGVEFSAPDLAYFSEPGALAALQSHSDEAFRQGAIGYATDAFVQAQPWAFDPAGGSARIRVIHGDSDAVLPLSHSQHTAELTRSTLEVVPAHGHLSIMREFPAIFGELAKSHP